MKRLLIAAALLLSFNAVAGNIFTETDENDGNKILTDKVVSPSDFYVNGNKNNYIKVGMCGFAPFPPFGCRVGACVCDSTGQNCQYTFICK